MRSLYRATLNANYVCGWRGGYMSKKQESKGGRSGVHMDLTLNVIKIMILMESDGPENIDT